MVSPGRIRRRGEMVEWFKASVLKTDEGQPSGGSNPPLSAIFIPAREGRVVSSFFIPGGHRTS